MISSAYNTIILNEVGASVHLIAPITDLQVENNKEKIIGFSKEHVFVLGDKKRGLSNDNLRNDLKFAEDGFVDFAEEVSLIFYS